MSVSVSGSFEGQICLVSTDQQIHKSSVSVQARLLLLRRYADDARLFLSFALFDAEVREEIAA